MKNVKTLANINLYAVMRNLEDLCSLDHVAKDMINGVDLSIQFLVKNGPEGQLVFKDNTCQFNRGRHRSNVKLYFTSVEHFNNMVDGDGNPIPLKGFTKLKFLLGDFMKLTDRLEHFLRPTPELLEDAKYTHINTTLTAYTAFFALAEIGNTDPIGKLSGKRIPDGKISVSIEGGPSVYLHKTNNQINAYKGIPKDARALMTFTNMKTAGDLLNGNTDSYSCIAEKTLKLKGFIPMLDNMNKLLGQVPEYL